MADETKAPKGKLVDLSAYGAGGQIENGMRVSWMPKANNEDDATRLTALATSELKEAIQIEDHGNAFKVMVNLEMEAQINVKLLRKQQEEDAARQFSQTEGDANRSSEEGLQYGEAVSTKDLLSV